MSHSTSESQCQGQEAGVGGGGEQDGGGGWVWGTFGIAFEIYIKKISNLKKPK